jgi:acetyl-CoA synthetase
VGPIDIETRVRAGYGQTLQEFDWSSALRDLGWLGQDQVDLAWTMVDRHLQAGLADRTAVHWIGRDGREHLLRFKELAEQSAQFANCLARLGVQKGDRVAVMLPRTIETVPILVGTLRAGAILVPIFGGFGGDAVAYRLQHSEAKVICVAQLYRHLVPARDDLTTIVVGASGNEQSLGRDLDYATAMQREDTVAVSVRYARTDPAAIIYTSGSTGQPKGCVIAANLLLTMWPYVRYGLDYRPDSDVFWPTGDPSWGYGLCCYLPALAIGGTVLCTEANATARVCLDILERRSVTNLATTPTVLRDLMALGEPALRGKSRLRAVSSCGEPLNDEVVRFFRRVWNVTPMDHFGATEFGLPVGNHNGIEMATKPGSMGLPAPGQTMSIVDEDGSELPTGSIGLIAQYPSDYNRYWLRYWNDESATTARYRGKWICTGDLGRKDDDGYFWFEGRTDDVIKSAGYRIGPFEIESAALKHESVAEAAAIGIPDELRGQIVKLFVVLAPEAERSQPVADSIVELIKTTCGSHLYPRQIAFVNELPKTETGKIQRFRLRQDSLRQDSTSARISK